MSQDVTYVKFQIMLIIQSRYLWYQKFFYQEIFKVIFYGNSKLKLIWRWDIGKQQFSRRKWKNTTTVVFDDHKNEACVCTKFSYSYRSNLCIRQNVKETKQQEKDFLQNNKKGTNKRSSQSYEEVSFMWWAYTSTTKKKRSYLLFSICKTRRNGSKVAFKWVMRWVLIDLMDKMQW